MDTGLPRPTGTKEGPRSARTHTHTCTAQASVGHLRPAPRGPGSGGACCADRPGGVGAAQSTPPWALTPLSAANPGGILVMKSCAPTCPNSTVSSDGRALSVSCCQGSQCNRSAAVGLGGGRGAWGVRTLASLLWVLLWAAW